MLDRPPGEEALTEPARTDAELRAEFDRQVARLVEKGYPELTGLQETAFVRRLAPLAEKLGALPPPGGGARVASVVVVGEGLVPREPAISRVELGGQGGFTSMDAGDLQRFAPLEALELPRGAAYLVTDVDTGRSTLDVTPDDALETIERDARSPLTIDEGVALVTHYPDVLRTRNCFSMLGSRCGDRRVAAIWISDRRPRLGWCWAGNPHTWLGSASCAGRIAA